MRLAIKAILALSTSPKGFTAGDVAAKVRQRGGLPESAYGTRQAAYDVKKLRGKQMVQKRPRSRRYETMPEGLRAMAALVLLRDH
jgi:repressor of nif and glnA expression